MKAERKIWSIWRERKGPLTEAKAEKVEERLEKHRRGGLRQRGGGLHHSAALTGWYLHLAVIFTGFCRAQEEEEERRGENLSPVYLWAWSPAVQEPAFQECLIFKSLISAPVLSIAVLYFYMSFACSSSNLAPTVFLLLWRCTRRRASAALL